MKKTITLISFILFSFNIYSQIVVWDFCEDFEDFNANDYIAQSSDNWNTWGELMSGWIAPFNDDAMVVNDTASSGSNSLYFIDATGTGGPQDIILMFDTTPNITASTLSTLSTPYVGGNFLFSQKMFVVPGKTGYFNFQEENIPGVSWSLQVELDSLGNINMTNGAVTPLFNTTYSLGVWFEISFDIDLTNNSWKVYIDGVLQGSFTNTNPTTMLPCKIASLDLYPAISSEFYVDEICFSYTPPTPTWDCDGQGNCNDPGTGFGQYSTLSACQTACPQISWDCNPISGACINPGTGSGQYSTYQQCVAVCGINAINDIESKIEIYPNPVKDLLNIKGDYEEILIYDISGKEVLKQEKVNKINISNLSSGIYFLKIRKEKIIENKKIVIEK